MISGSVAVALDSVRREVLVHRDEVETVSRDPPGAGDPRGGADDHVVREPRLGERCEREDGCGRVAARIGDEPGAPDLVAMELREPVDRVRQELRRSVVAVGLLVDGQVVQPEVGGDVDHGHSGARRSSRRPRRPPRAGRRRSPPRSPRRAPCRARSARSGPGSADTGDPGGCPRPSARWPPRARGCGWRWTRLAASAPAKPEAPATTTRASLTERSPDLGQRSLDGVTPLGDLGVGERAVRRPELEPQREALASPLPPARRGRRRRPRRCGGALRPPATTASRTVSAGTSSSTTIARSWWTAG